MQIADQKVVVIHYKLTDSEGQVIDSSEGQEPMPYLHGDANIVPGLEKEPDGKVTGDKINTVVAPEDGYGQKDANLVQELPSSSFGGVDEIKVGMEFHAQTENGMQVVEVIDVTDDTVTIDGNHPLADQELHFEIKVVATREASADEIAQGHLESESSDN